MLTMLSEQITQHEKCMVALAPGEIEAFYGVF